MSIILSWDSEGLGSDNVEICKSITEIKFLNNMRYYRTKYIGTGRIWPYQKSSLYGIHLALSPGSPVLVIPFSQSILPVFSYLAISHFLSVILLVCLPIQLCRDQVQATLVSLACYTLCSIDIYC